jgi:two-component system, NarL family, invasion response regulator UvrY
MIRVFIADDHAIVRKGFCQIIEETDGMEVAGEAATGDAVLEQVMKADWDVLVLDLSMPGRSGLDVIQAVRDLKPKLPILVLSMHPEDQYAVRLLKNGISGYINKETALDNLVSAIRKVIAGGKYVSETLAEKLAFDLTGPMDKGSHESLSDREYRVLCMIGQGKSVSQIAEELFISVKTVSTYRTRILEKMNLNTTADLIRYAVENNLSY